MWSGGRWFCEDRKDWPAERSPWCICCWTCKCDNSRTSWSPGKFFHQFFNSASMQWHFKLREPASDAEMKVDIAAANFLWIIWYLVDLLFSNGIITWLGSRITFLSVDGGGSLFHPQGFDFYCWKEIALRWCYMQVLLRKGGPTTVWQFILWYQCQFWWEDMTDSAENWLSALISLLRNNHEEMFTTLWFLFVIWWIAFCYLYSLLNYVFQFKFSHISFCNVQLHWTILPFHVAENVA